jgi:hypothetical protein
MVDQVSWPFSLGVRGRDAVVTISPNQVVALDSATGTNAGAPM